ncbi:MAG: 6-phosphogluconolactonase, partial [Ottowia sp.]|nr:6-phosphogluconolactonase [Ottowia sp.]
MNNDLSTRIERRDFANPAALAKGLAQSVADDLHAALQARALASLALSGGNTPKAFMQALAQQPLDWARVVVTLVD